MRSLIALLSLCLVGCDYFHSPPTATTSETQAAEIQTVLESEAGEPITNPTDEQIRQRLSRLTNAPGGEGFAILSQDQMTYLQVAINDTDRFQMEYQEGGLTKHYKSDRDDFTIEEVMQAFIQYRDGTIDWSRYGKWSLLDLPG